MAKIKVLAGDFLQGDGEYYSGSITLETPLYPWPGTRISISTIKALEIASKASNKKIDDAIALGLAGAIVLGPLGAAAGFMLASEEIEVTFLATLKDGRKLLAATDDKTYRQIASAVHRPSEFFQ